ncbi:nucleotidyltransferase family protein [Paraglaciecola aestuariivivens]
MSIANDFTPEINEQTFLDLACWLTKKRCFSQAQLARLKDESHYLNIIALANHFWLLGHLANQLKKQTFWPDLPSELRNYLTQIEELYQKRSLAIKQEVLNVCTLLAPITQDLVLLKGAATLFNGISEPIGSRYMADIDILLPNNKLKLGIQTLSSHHYQFEHDEMTIYTSAFHHAPPAIRPNGPCYIELHRQPLVNSIRHLLDCDEAFNTATTLALDSKISVKQLHPTQQVIHCIAHSELQDQRFKEAYLDLRQLVNFYLIVNKFNSQICWKTIEKRFRDTQHIEELRSVVYQANRLFDLPIYISTWQTEATHTHYLKCVNNAAQLHQAESNLQKFSQFIQGYSSHTIVNLYGENGTFPLITGRLKHGIRHLRLVSFYLAKKLFKQKNIKR